MIRAGTEISAVPFLKSDFDCKAPMLGKPKKYGYWLAVCFLVVIGCNSNEPFEYVDANGKLSYEDGTPIGKGGIRLQFVSIDQEAVEGLHPRPALANVDADGNFDSVTSYKFGDGLLPGKHKVAILSAKDESGRPLIPKEYSHVKTTPLIVDTANVPLMIKVPKP